MASTTKFKAYCVNCGPDRLAEVRAEFKKLKQDFEYGIWAETFFRVLQCPACEAVSFQKDMTFSENTYRDSNGEEHLAHEIEQWPSPTKKRDCPNWSGSLDSEDSILSSLFDNVYVAFENDLNVLAAIGIRTTFDRASEKLDVDPSLGFADKIKKLKDAGKISSEEANHLNILTEADNAAAHRGWVPTDQQLESMIDLLESFLHRSFVVGKAATELKGKYPSRPPRKSKVVVGPN